MIVIGGISWISSLLFLLAASYLIAREFRPARSSFDFTDFVFVGILLTTFKLLILGLIGNLRPIPIMLVSMMGLGVLFIVGPTRRALKEIRSVADEQIKSLMSWWKELPAWLQKMILVLILVLSFRFIFLAWALPPFVWDSLTYHLTNVGYWTQTGRIEIFDTPVDRIFLPANFEVFTTWFVVFIHHDVILELAGIPPYVLACLSVYRISRRLGLPSSSAALSAIGYGTVPAVLLVVTGTKNDPLMAGLYLYANALLLRIVVRDEGLAPKYRNRLWLLLLVVILFGVGTKAYIFHLLPGIVVLWVIMSRHFRTFPQLSLDLRQLKDQVFQVFSSFSQVFLLGAGLLLGMYWSVRNWIVTGNPFFPFGVSVGGNRLLTTEYGSAQFGLANFLENIAVISAKFGDKQFPIMPDLPETTGWGWVIYGLGVPAFLWGIWRLPVYRRLALSFLISFFALLLSNSTSPWNMRYLIWFPAIFAVGIGMMEAYLPSQIIQVQILFRNLLWACIMLNILMVATYNRVSIGDFQQMLSLPVFDRDAAVLRLNVPEEYQNAIMFVPKEETLGYNVTSNGFVYPLFRADFSQSLVYIPLQSGTECTEIAHAMREAGTRYLFVAPEHTGDDIIERLRECSDTETEIRQRSRGLYVLKD